MLEDNVEYNSVMSDEKEKPKSLCDVFCRKEKIKGLLTLIGGFALMLYLGCFFLWGNISIYVKCNVVNSIIRFLSFLQTNTRSVSGDGTSPAFYDDAHRPGIVVAGRRGSLSSRYEQ